MAIIQTEHDYHRFPVQTIEYCRDNLKANEWRTIYFAVYEKDFGTYSVSCLAGKVQSVAEKSFKIVSSATNNPLSRSVWKVPFDVLLAVF